MDKESILVPPLRKFWSFFSNRYLNSHFIRFTAIAVIFLAVVNLIIILWTSSGGVNIFGTWVGGDYPCFYIAGKMLNEYPSETLYDFKLHSEILHDLLPGISPNEEIPYINPPFFALIFMPMAKLPYIPSYLVWMLVSVILYVTAFKLFWKTLDAIPSNMLNTALLLALSFEPFIMENILGGNCSAIGFLALAMFLYFDHCNKDIPAGLSLGLLLYKPTFLIFLLPMLLLSRRFNILFGFGLCSLVLGGLSIMTVGWETSVEYVRFLCGYSTIRFSPGMTMRLWKYVDIVSFSRLYFGNLSSPMTLLLIAAVSVPSIFFSMRLWWKADCLNQSGRELMKAVAITLTIFINLHFGIYDCVFIVLSALLTINALHRHGVSNDTGAYDSLFHACLVSIFFLPWLTQNIARHTEVQLLTLAVGGMMGYQLFLGYAFQRNGLSFQSLRAKTLKSPSANSRLKSGSSGR